MRELPNVDTPTVAGFGHEWTTFSQEELSAEDRAAMFEGYFHRFPWSALPEKSIGADIGCGSGRWAQLVAPRVGHLHLVDPSADALEVAKRNLSGSGNVSFRLASASDLPFDDATLDFAYTLGVLHHVPDTEQAIKDIARKLKPGAPFLVYLYYAFDNRPAWYRQLWLASNALRLALSRAPRSIQYAASQAIAACVYWPLARSAAVFERLGLPCDWMPLSYYRRRRFYVMRTDAYDRFCTRLEKRFTKAQIAEMLSAAGFDNIVFSDRIPYWVAVATKR